MADGVDERAMDVDVPADRVVLSARSALIWMAIATVVLIVLHVAVKALDDGPGAETLDPIFDLNGESNVPAWYSASLWLVAAAIAALIAVATRLAGGAFVLHWFGIAAVCLFLSIDEAALIHETMGNVLRRSVFDRWPQLDVDDGWIYSWMYYGIAFVIGFLVVFRRFMAHLPRHILWLMVLSGAVFLAGAFGVESVSAAIEHENIREPTGNEWLVIIVAEEGLEMAGVGLFIYSLLRYVASGPASLTLPVVR